MRLIVNTKDGEALEIQDFDAASLMTMLEDWEHASILGFALNDGMAYIPKTAITRIDTFD